MRMSQAEKAASRQRIVASAARLARGRGVEGASVGAVMADAGLTHGGFYRHFATKDDLLAAAVAASFGEIAEQIAAEPAGFDEFYLSDRHIGHPAIGCPIPALGSEVARGGDGLKAAFGAGIRRVVAAMAAGRRGSAAARNAAATRDLAMLAGAVMIARASDPETAAAVLDACRAAIPRRAPR